MFVALLLSAACALEKSAREIAILLPARDNVRKCLMEHVRQPLKREVEAGDRVRILIRVKKPE